MQALKRKFSELQNATSAYERIFQLLRDRPGHEADAIIRVIRDGASADSVVEQIDHGDLLLQLRLIPESSYMYQFPYVSNIPAFMLETGNPYLDIIRKMPTNDPSVQGARPPQENVADIEAVYLKPYHSAMVLEPLLANIKVSQWTNVSRDEPFLHSLLETYFLHNYAYFAFFHKEYFLRDMKELRHNFCSSPLVNAVLAHACHSHPQMAYQNEYWNPKSVEYMFIAEAKRLLETEAIDSTGNITTVQALLLLNLTINEQGLDKVGFSYLVKAVNLAKAMGLFSVVGAPNISKEMKVVRDFTAWSLFRWQA
jgi:hypothetical protein